MKQSKENWFMEVLGSKGVCQRMVGGIVLLAWHLKLRGQVHNAAPAKSPTIPSCRELAEPSHFLQLLTNASSKVNGDSDVRGPARDQQGMILINKND